MHDPAASREATALGVGHRGRAEVEAESVAYVVTSAYGMRPDDYSLNYVAVWAGTDRPAEDVRATWRRVVEAAQRVLRSLRLDPGPDGPPPGLAPVPRHVAHRGTPPLLAPAPVGEAIGR